MRESVVNAEEKYIKFTKQIPLAVTRQERPKQLRAKRKAKVRIPIDNHVRIFNQDATRKESDVSLHKKQQMFTPVVKT